MAFFDIFKKKTVSSSNIAKGRLQLALASDRAGCSPEIMEKIKNDIINVAHSNAAIEEFLKTNLSSAAESRGRNLKATSIKFENFISTS